MVTPSQDNLPEFTRRVHRDVSCAINTLLASQRYDAPRELFDGRAAHYQRLCDDGAQAVRLLYDHLNCVAAGLVDRPEHMPGHVFDFDLWRTGYLDVPRPPLYFGDDARVRPEVIRMHVTPPPLLYEAFGGDLERLIYYLSRLTEDATRRVRAIRKRPALGARAVRRLHPWSEPRSLRERGGQRVPSFSVGASGALGRKQSIEAAREVRTFRRTYSDVRLARREGNRRRRYPFGTYAMRVVHNEPVERDSDATAIVGRPGPLLSDIEARLREQAAAQDATRERSLELIARLRQTITDDSATLAADAEMDFANAGVSDMQAPERSMVTRHRFAPSAPNDPAQQAGLEAARRLVILRDRRIGRPPRQPHHHGADPPV